MAFGDFTVDRNSTKYVLGSGGTIISYATDEPAVEFNTDGSFKGLLVEPAATNLCLRSENITTTWVPINATRTANATTALDGNTTADKLGDNGATGTGNVTVFQTITVSSSTKYTASVFLKADQLAFARLEAYQYDGANTGEQYFGLSGDGSLGTASNLDDSTITKYPDGWYRCSITFTTGANTTFPFAIYLANSISSTIVNLDGTSSIFVWGAQVEASPIATSYIPTTTASVTRVKDDITQTGAQSLIGQTEGTLYVEVDWRLATGTTQRLLSASNGTFDNRVLIYKDTSTPNELRMFARADGNTKTDQGVDSTGFSGIQKFAFAYADSDFELYRNGSSISSDTTGSLSALATLTNIDIGQQTFSQSAQANMWIRAVALYPTRLGTNDLIILTGGVILTVEYLVIAGGGGGGFDAGGGGGAGGYRSSVSGESSGGGASAESVFEPTLSTNYTVTIGAGGAAGTVINVPASSGSNSIFDTITSTGGGGGGSKNTNGVSGGSGGGGGHPDGNSGGTGTSGQGLSGGNSFTNAGGGGGGASQAGSNGVDGSGGDGGDGVSSAITGSAITRAGGGGGGNWQGDAAGGTGGNGGGGNGAGATITGTAGTVNTGGGGGAGGVGSTTASAGGSGVVILRYPSSYAITIGAGLTGSEATDGAYKVATITAGTGNVSWN